MKTRWKKYALIGLFWAIFAFGALGAEASAAGNIGLICSKITIAPRETADMGNMVTPKSFAKRKLKWKSSNEKIAKVSNSGKVTGVKEGTATVTVKTAAGRAASCVVKVSTGAKNYVVNTTAGTQKYRLYDQTDYGGYIAQSGCTLTAVSIVASHYGLNYSPVKIHNASVSAKYGERYAAKSLPGPKVYGHAAVSVATLSKILTNLGIKNRAVYKFNKKDAIREIKRHAAQGKPVLLKLTNRRYNGYRLANGHHTMVLAGIDSDGYGIFLEPYGGKINYTHASKNQFRMKVSTVVNEFMQPAQGNYKGAYVLGLNTAGGYILVDGI